MESRGRENQGMMRAFIELAQAGIQVPANRREAGAREQTDQLRNAAHTAGPDRR